MSLSDEQFREQLVDYLYGELGGASLEAFEAELVQPERRAELEAMRETLRAARSGLAALHEEPPAGARAAILAAEQAAREAPRVLRGPWFRRMHAGVVVPMLAAAAAVAFAVLAPRRDEVPGENYEAPAAVPFPGSSPALAPADKLEQPQADEVAPAVTKGGAPASNEDKRVAPARSRRARAEGAASGGGPRAPAKDSDDFGSERESLGSLREAEPPEERAKKMRDDVASEKAAKPAGAAAPVQRSAQRSAPASSYAAPAAPMRAQSESAQQVPTAPEDAVEKARALANARRWADAAIAYRELLQRYPQDPRAASWRSELGRVARELSSVPLVP